MLKTKLQALAGIPRKAYLLAPVLTIQDLLSIAQYKPSER